MSERQQAMRAKIMYYAKAIVGGAALVAGAVVGTLAPHSWPWDVAEAAIVLAGVLGIARVTNVDPDQPASAPAEAPAP